MKRHITLSLSAVITHFSFCPFLLVPISKVHLVDSYTFSPRNLVESLGSRTYTGHTPLVRSAYVDYEFRGEGVGTSIQSLM